MASEDNKGLYFILGTLVAIFAFLVVRHELRKIAANRANGGDQNSDSRSSRNSNGGGGCGCSGSSCDGRVSTAPQVVSNPGVSPGVNSLSGDDGFAAGASG